MAELQKLNKVWVGIFLVIIIALVGYFISSNKASSPDENNTSKLDSSSAITDQAKEIVVAVGANITTLDPYDANDSLSQNVAKSFYEGLFGLDKDLQRTNVLATGYEISESGLIYTIDLRSGVKFHDGTDFDADAVKVNLERVIAPNTALKRANLFRAIKSVEVLDKYKVAIILKEPFSPFINTLAHPAAVMISPKALKKYGKEIGFNPVGTGPYKLEQWNSTDFIKVTKFANYWQEGLPKLDSITWRPVVENNTRSAMLQSGEAHFAYPIPFEQVGILTNNRKVDVIVSASIQQRYISMNVKQKPFDDLRVRQALNYAINKEALIKVVFAGNAVVAQSPVPPAILYSKQFNEWPYDLAKARKLLAEAGYPEGFSTTLWASHNHSTAQKVLQFIQQQLAQVGVKVTVLPMDAGQRAEQVEGKGVNETGVRLFYTGWSASTGEANWAITPLFATSSWPPAIFNTAFYSNAKVDAGLAKALTLTSEQEKQKVYDQVQQQIWDDVPWIFLLTEELVSARSKQLKRFYMMPDTGFDFYKAELVEEN